MGIYATKSKWQQALNPLVDLSLHFGVHPDVFTCAALGFSGLAGWALFQASVQPLWLMAVPICVLLRLLCNLLDGQVARASGLADAWGEVKNEFGDRLADAAIFVGLGFGGYTDARLAMLALALILCVSYLGLLGKALGGARIYGGVFGKGDRMISLAAFTLYPLLGGRLDSYNVYLAFAALMAVITIAQRLRTTYCTFSDAHAQEQL